MTDDDLLIRATEYYLCDDPKTDTITIHYSGGPSGRLEIPMSRPEFLSIQSRDGRLDYIASKIRDALATLEPPK